MPICEEDPWRLQFFADVECPDNVLIPTDDGDAWLWNPSYRWVYDRLLLAQMQGLRCGPHGVMPTEFPVFSKPITNLQGMGVGIRSISSRSEYEQTLEPGHFWMDALSGEHISSDVAVQMGKAKWWRHAIGCKGSGLGTFDHWTISAERFDELERMLGAWIDAHFTGYTGMLNIETIGGIIIEAHLRFSAQWPDLYGRGWVDALVHLYSRGEWKFDKEDRHTGFSVPLFLPFSKRYRLPSSRALDRHTANPHISSVQITFFEGEMQHLNPMPPGGFRAAVINGSDLEAAITVREELRRVLAD